MAEANKDKSQNLSSERRNAPEANAGQSLESYRSRAPERGNSPFSLMRRMLNDMDRLFGNFGDFGSSSLLNRGDEGWARQFWSPQVDIFERDQNLVIHADLPGLREEDVKVNVERGMLTISGQRQHETAHEREGNLFHRERSFGSFQRVLSLPENADPEQIRASFENGVLEVTVPIPEQSRRQGRDIPISPKTQSNPTH
ncbi:MAG TPA: Hsp20/alpha crystallin family protein [Polyangiaceae bacterium]|nr:Hsp20/alpha crystallin family protein [Polyangiaceae bacterium]